MSTINRIVKIHQLLDGGRQLTAPELTEILNEPLGTISSFCSFMHHTRNLKKNENHAYYLPAFTKAPVEIAKEIQRYLKSKREERAKMQPEKRQAIKLDFEREVSGAIEAAIELLKSHGYKILKSKNEWSEV